MIPVKLELKNFLSYGEQLQEVDFKSYPLICLSGKNGHGKSALLDAITWALWGQARKTFGNAKPDAGLLRLGQTQMLVALEFSFNGRMYKVRREFAKTYGKDYAALDFSVRNEESGEYITLTDKTIRTTQKKIEELLGLDFDTFVNSAFLKQGHSNEFSKKSAKERKAILGSILGLSRYDILKVKSLEHAKNHAHEREVLEKLNAKATDELLGLAQLTKDQKETAEKLKELNKLRMKSEKTALEFKKKQLAFFESKQRYEAFEKEKKALEKRIAEHLENFREKRATWQALHKKRLSMENPAALKRMCQELLLEEAAQRKHQEEALKDKEELLKLQEAHAKSYALLKERHEKKAYELVRRIDAGKLLVKQQKSNQLIGEAELKTLVHLREGLAKKETEGLSIISKLTADLKNAQAIKDQFEKRRSYYQALVQRGNVLTTHVRGLSEQKEKLVHPDNQSCPLCDQIVSSKRKQFLAKKISADEGFYHRRLERISSLLSSLKTVLVLQHTEVQDITKKEQELQRSKLGLESVSKELTQANQKVTNTEKKLKEIAQEQVTLERQVEKTEQELKTEKEVFSKVLQVDAGLIGELTTITALKERLKKSSYDPKVHQQLIADIKKYEEKLLGLSKLTEDLSKLEQVAASVSEENRAIKRLRGELKISNASLEKLAFTPQEEKTLQAEETSLHASAHEIVRQEQELNQKEGRIKGQLERLLKLKEETATQEKKVKNLEVEIGEYQMLAKILGKDGLQALLIEEAIPEIEEEANETLSRITDNGSQIFIESLRDLKKGGVKETLDIRISDSSGLRSYEMFSGGEAFRIDFALRIAISKLLARRAGTALQTLIIDEGFGSQDEEGLSRLMDAILAIQDDFACVIVVSHLPALKENFPIHFVIEKGPSGSHVTVIERG